MSLYEWKVEQGQTTTQKLLRQEVLGSHDCPHPEQRWHERNCFMITFIPSHEII